MTRNTRGVAKAPRSTATKAGTDKRTSTSNTVNPQLGSHGDVCTAVAEAAEFLVESK